MATPETDNGLFARASNLLKQKEEMEVMEKSNYMYIYTADEVRMFQEAASSQLSIYIKHVYT